MTDPVKVLSDDDVSEIEARANAATAGPWIYFGEPENNVFWGEVRSAAEDGHFDHITDTPELDERDNDMEFIAHAREDIPALCATVRALSASLSKANEVVEEAVHTNTALREQLAEAEAARDQLSNALSVRDAQLAQERQMRIDAEKAAERWYHERG